MFPLVFVLLSCAYQASSLLPQYKQNPEMFKQTARLWSHVYAGAPTSSPDYTRKIDKLCAMGFDKVRTCLETSVVKQSCVKVCSGEYMTNISENMLSFNVIAMRRKY